VQTKRQFIQSLGLVAAGAAGGLAAPATMAQTAFPERPIRVVIPFPPGGSVDPIARVVLLKTGELLGQPMVLDNRAGGNTAIGAGLVSKAAPDGYTLMFTAASTHVLHTLQAPQPYDALKDFLPVGAASRSSYMLAVHPSVPARTLPELIAFAKANPGRLNYASSGTGNTNHLAGELFNLLAGTRIVHVPYKGGAPALQDLVAGRVQMMLTNVPLLQPQVDAGNLRALAYTSQRAGRTQDPTFSQYGMPEFEQLESLNVLLAPAGTPEAVIEKVAAALQKALATAEVRSTIENQLQAAFFMPPAALGARMRAERAKFVEVIDKGGISLTN